MCRIPFGPFLIAQDSEREDRHPDRLRRGELGEQPGMRLGVGCVEFDAAHLGGARRLEPGGLLGQLLAPPGSQNHRAAVRYSFGQRQPDLAAATEDQDRSRRQVRLVHRVSLLDYCRAMPVTPVHLTPDGLDFVRERHLATLTTIRPDGTPHVVAVGFTWDPDAGIVRVITGGGSVKVRNVRRHGYAAVSQVDGPRWLTLEGIASVTDDPAAVADAEARYARRYRVPRPNPTGVVLQIEVRRVLAGSRLRGPADQSRTTNSRGR